MEYEKAAQLRGLKVHKHKAGGYFDSHHNHTLDLSISEEKQKLSTLRARSWSWSKP